MKQHLAIYILELKFDRNQGNIAKVQQELSIDQVY